MRYGILDSWQLVRVHERLLKGWMYNSDKKKILMDRNVIRSLGNRIINTILIESKIKIYN